MRASVRSRASLATFWSSILRARRVKREEAEGRVACGPQSREEAEKEEGRDETLAASAGLGSPGQAHPASFR